MGNRSGHRVGGIRSGNRGGRTIIHNTNNRRDSTRVYRGGTRNFRGDFRGRHRFIRDGSGFRHRGNFRGHRRFVRGHRGFSRSSRFFVGGFIPSFFLGPQFYIGNYPSYGLSAPRRGYRWVRHYDDAYLVDGRGYVADTRYGVPYDTGYSGGGYYEDGYADDRYYDRERSSAGDAAIGAVAGGVLGGVAGNLIAGRGDRTEGTIIGAGIGAIAGGVIGSEAGRDRRDGRYYSDDRYDDRRYRDRGYRDGGYERDRHDAREPVPEYVGDLDYYPDYGTTYGRDYEVEREESYAPAPAQRYVPAPQPRAPIHTDVHVSSGHPGVTTHYGSDGITQTATTSIVLNSPPATTTTTFIEEEVEYVAPRRRTAHRRPARRANSCNCD